MGWSLRDSSHPRVRANSNLFLGSEINAIEHYISSSSHAPSAFWQSGTAPRPYLLIKPKPQSAHRFRALYDTGASISVFCPDDIASLRRLGHSPVALHYKCSLKNASNQAMKVLSAYYIHAYFDGLPLKGVVVCSPDVNVSIVGTNIIRQNNLVYNPVNNSVIRQKNNSAP